MASRHTSPLKAALGWPAADAFTLWHDIWRKISSSTAKLAAILLTCYDLQHSSSLRCTKVKLINQQTVLLPTSINILVFLHLPFLHFFPHCKQIWFFTYRNKIKKKYKKNVKAPLSDILDINMKSKSSCWVTELLLLPESINMSTPGCLLVSGTFRLFYLNQYSWNPTTLSHRLYKTASSCLLYHFHISSQREHIFLRRCRHKGERIPDLHLSFGGKGLSSGCPCSSGSV